MSRSKSGNRPPPFTVDDDDVAILGGRTAPAKGFMADVRKGPREQLKEPLSKKPRLVEGVTEAAKGSSDTLPPIPTPHHTGGVASAFVKYGLATASEPEVLTWTTSPLDENQSILTKILGEAWLRQASHAREIKGLIAAKDKAEKDAKALKLKALV